MSRRQAVIVGSLHSGRLLEPPPQQPDLAESACEEMGAALAAAGWDIVVFSDNVAFIEQAVVRGYLAAAEKRKRHGGKVIIRAPRRQMSKIALDSPLVEYQPDASDEWEVSFYRSLFSADGLVLMGGGRSTRIAGILALTNGIPLVPLATFGGSAASVWSKMKTLDHGVSDEDVAVLGRKWGPKSAHDVVAVLGRQHDDRGKPGEPDRAARRRKLFGTLTAALSVLLAASTLVLAHLWRQPLAALTLIVTGPMLASVAGALLRDSYAGADDEVRAAVRGLGAGFTSMALYIASQLLAAPGLIDELDARQLLWLLLPLGIVAGLTYETVYAKVRKAQITNVSALTQPGAGP
ncbi:hypothetical protein ACIA8G_10425 [Lentzea sp. NPDC051213]|uniref:hypothetical protein n=1 Tax=Lentzea sp. NPDC051213 TaxID=3364126 RepID=UPI00379944E5